jgi:hypothetical protein
MLQQAGIDSVFDLLLFLPPSPFKARVREERVAAKMAAAAAAATAAGTGEYWSTCSVG